MRQLQIIKTYATVLAIVLSHPALCGAQTAEHNAYVRFVKAGMEQMKSGHYEAARDYFEEAIRYNDAGGAAHLGLGIAYLQLREDRAAVQELTRAAEINPNEATSYKFLGELYYRNDDLESAVTSWEKAAALNPSDIRLREKLDRIKKEHSTEMGFNREVSSHFLIKYEGREKIEAGRIVLRILENAYGEVGRALSYYPDHEVQVILYSSQQFQEVTDAPGWSKGIFDGKIRIPIGGIEQETPGLRRILYHEYAHAVVREIAPRCATWLNEGLAQYFEGREIDVRQHALLRQIAQAGKLPSLSSLEGSFLGLDFNQASYAYLYSLSSVRYMIDSFGLYRVKAVLDELDRGTGLSSAISNGLMISYEAFERGWKQSLE
jgi:tetratricopeptide (TPR) repeat protein